MRASENMMRSREPMMEICGAPFVGISGPMMRIYFMPIVMRAQMSTIGASKTKKAPVCRIGIAPIPIAPIPCGIIEGIIVVAPASRIVMLPIITSGTAAKKDDNDKYSEPNAHDLYSSSSQLASS